MPEQLSGDPGLEESAGSNIQRVDEIEIKESEKDAEFTVFGQDDAKSAVQNLLTQRYWWFREEFRDLEATEQFTFDDGENSIEVFNFSEKLADEQAKEIEQTLNDLRSTKFGLSVIDYILISSEERESSYEKSEPARGRIHFDARTLVLLPAAMQLTDYRKGQVKGISEVRGTTLHEIGHQIYQKHKTSEDKPIQNEWNRDFATYDSEKGINIPTDPDHCATTYGRHSAHEDFAESFVVYLTQPELLSEKAPDKFAFMDKNIGKRKTEPAELVRNDQIRYPRIEGIVKYDRAGPIKIGNK